MKKLMATAAVVALLAGTGFAQDNSVKRGPAPERAQMKEGKHRDMMADIPNLTEEQKSQIKAIREEGRKQSEPQHKEMKELRSKLQELKAAENPDQKQINQLIDKSASLKAEMEKSRTASELKVRSILTPEQRKVVDAKQKEHIEMREKKQMERKEMKDAK